MNLFKKHFLYTSFVFCSVTSSLFCTKSAEVFEVSNTPQRSLGTAVSMDQTPGQRLVIQQASIFTEDIFRQVFGDEFYIFLGTLGSDIASAQKKWSVLSDTTISFDDIRKRLLVSQISKFMDKKARNRVDEGFQSLYGRVLAIHRAIGAVNIERLEERSVSYFKCIYPNSMVDCIPKNGGVQLGTIVNIRKQDGSNIKYYVKTHSSGLLSGHSSAAELLRPQELMVYRVLEKLGVGCESHFFGRDGKNFYIATLDANTEGKFREYSQFDQKKDDEIVRLWGSLIFLDDSPKENEKNHEVIEERISRDNISQNFILQISYLDLLARLMRLVDLQTNGTNYGFLNSESSLPTLKIIDFRLRDLEEEDDFKITENHFKGFLKGNGSFHYISADKAVCYILRNRTKELRVEQARQVFEQRFMNWMNVIRESQHSTRNSLVDLDITTTEREKIDNELDSYTSDVISNFQLFEKLLQEWKPD